MPGGPLISELLDGVKTSRILPSVSSLQLDAFSLLDHSLILCRRRQIHLHKKLRFIRQMNAQG